MPTMGAGGEESPDSYPRTVLLPECLFYYSLLSQFKLPQVRSDFANGRFGFLKRANDVTLSELDLLSSLLLPAWFGCDGISVRMDLEHRASHMVRLVEKQSKTLLLAEESDVPIRTYKQWYKILHELAFSSYWQESDRCTYPVNERMSSFVTASSVHTNTETVQTFDVGVDACVFSSSDGGICDELATETLAVPLCSVTCDSGLVDSVDANNNTSILSSQPEFHKLEHNDPFKKIVLQKSSKSTSVCSLDAESCCSWCHKRGHREVNCWRKKGLCLICGSHHRMKECPRYIPPAPLAMPTCSSCGGGHLGMNCGRVKQRRRFCHWCGRQGHSEEACWVKSGACLICGSHSHVLPQCPKFIAKTVLPVFPPWCARCGSHHIGSECDSPYME